MSGVFSQFRFWSPKLVQNPTPRAVLASCGAKKIAVDIFRIKRTQSTPFDPKLRWGVFSQFRFRSQKLVRNPTLRAVLATYGAKKVAHGFFESNAPNPHRLTKNSCLVCLHSFGFGHQNSCETRPRGPFWLHKERKKLQMIFFESNAPNPPRLTQNSSRACFRSFGFGHRNSCKTRPGGPFWPLVERKKLQLTFFESNAPNPPRLTQNSGGVCFRSFGFGHKNSCETRP